MALVERVINDRLLSDKGMCGTVYTAQCADSGEPVIIKTFDDIEIFNVELEIFKQLHSKGLCRHLPEYRGSGLHLGKHCIYLSRYRHDLQHYFSDSGRLSKNSVVQVGLQILSAFEELHSIGILHADLKPDNIMVGRFGDFLSFNKLFLIDFSLATPYTHKDHPWKKPSSKAQHIEPGPAEERGNPGFCSRAAAAGKTLCRRDDLEMLVYMMMFLESGQHLFHD
jgi:serine/threonine protein kinase